MGKVVVKADCSSNSTMKTLRSHNNKTTGLFGGPVAFYCSMGDPHIPWERNLTDLLLHDLRSCISRQQRRQLRNPKILVFDEFSARYTADAASFGNSFFDVAAYRT